MGDGCFAHLIEHIWMSSKSSGFQLKSNHFGKVTLLKKQLPVIGSNFALIFFSVLVFC